MPARTHEERQRYSGQEPSAPVKNCSGCVFGPLHVVTAFGQHPRGDMAESMVAVDPAETRGRRVKA